MNRAVKRALTAVAPNLVDRVVNFFDPVRGTQRLQARAHGVMMAAAFGAGGYGAARRDRTALRSADRRDLSADAALLPDLDDMRAVSFTLYRNNPLARAAIKRVRTAVVGTGLRFKSSIDRQFLGLSDEAAERWEADAERLYAAHFGAKFFDAAQERNADQMAAAIVIQTLLAGDSLVLRRWIAPGKSSRRSALLGTCAQLVDTARLANPGRRADGVRLTNGNMVAGGVERDGDGAAVAYWLLANHPGDHNPGAPVRVAAADADGNRLAWHIYDAERAEQSRGEPFLAPVIEPLHQLGKYTEAELAAAVVAGMFTVFVKTPSGQGLAPADPTQPQEAGEYALGAGAILQGMPGDEIQTIDPNRPNVAFDPFVMACLRQIGAALEIPFEVLILHFTASYSAARAAILEAWRFFLRVRQWLVDEFYRPQYQAMISEAVARGLLPAPGFFDDPLVRAAYLGADWTGPAQGQLNPLQETKALTEQVAAGLNTHERATAQLGNGDFDANARALGREHRLMVEQGIDADPVAETIATDPVAVQPPDQTPDNPDQPESN